MTKLGSVGSFSSSGQLWESGRARERESECVRLINNEPSIGMLLASGAKALHTTYSSSVWFVKRMCDTWKYVERRYLTRSITVWLSDNQAANETLEYNTC